MKRLILINIVIVLVLFIACAPTVAPPTSAPTPDLTSDSTPKKITLDDAHDILNISLLLPSNFESLDPASEGMSKKDMELGSDFSEVALFLSEEPFQMIYGFLGIIESRVERAAADATFKDEQQIKSLLKTAITQGFAEEGLDFTNYLVEVTYPSIGDLAVMGEGQVAYMGLTAGFDILCFRDNKVYIYIYSSYSSQVKQSLEPIARELQHRIAQYSQ